MIAALLQSVTVILLFSYIVNSKEINDDITKIAIVEYKPLINYTINEYELIHINTDNYINLLKSLNQSIDLILFPEETLVETHFISKRNLKYITTFEKNTNPCKNIKEYPDYIQKISCAANKFNTTIVINVLEKVDCRNFPKNEQIGRNCKLYGYKIYNTDVIFNNNGDIIERYRKYNLFGELSKDKPDKAEVTIFPLKGRLRFGIFTCFDILFQHPAEDILKFTTNVLFPTYWYSELPFLTALQTQQMWSYAHDALLFSAGAHQPATGSGGTGAFDGTQGPYIQNYYTSNNSNVYLVKIDGNSSRNHVNVTLEDEIVENIDRMAVEMDKFYLKSDDTSRYASIVLNSTNTSVHLHLCHNGICCHLSAKLTNNSVINRSKNVYTYHFVAFSGIRSFSGVYNGGVEVCGLVACLDRTVNSCGKRFGNYSNIVWPLGFESIEIRANFTRSANKTQYPNSLLSSIRSINPQHTIWTKIEHANVVERTFLLTKPTNRLLTFAVYGRNFANDSDPFQPNSSQHKKFNWILLCIAIIFCFTNNFVNIML